MSIPIYEQETTINFYRDNDTAQIYTSDRTVMTRLDKLADDPGSPWHRKDYESTANGEPVGKFYTAPKALISFRRTRASGRVLTDEQKAEIRERLTASRDRRKNNA